MTKRQITQEKYNIARKNLLLMLILTIINILLVAFNLNIIMLFSATIPYYAVAIALFIQSNTLIIFGIGLAFILLVAYLVSWYFSKKHYGWMIFALILFLIDTLCMIALYISIEDFTGILDIIMHIWILYFLISGVINGYKLNKLPEDDIIFDKVEEIDIQSSFDDQYPSILRKADFSIKSRILLETEYHGLHICYRRVKRVNELIINCNVYDDIEMLLESSHALNARINGHTYQVGFDGLAHSYLRVDGQTVIKKLRLY